MIAIIAILRLDNNGGYQGLLYVFKVSQGLLEVQEGLGMGQLYNTGGQSSFLFRVRWCEAPLQVSKLKHAREPPPKIYHKSANNRKNQLKNRPM